MTCPLSKLLPVAIMENTSLWLGFKIRKEASYPEAEGGCVTQKTFESSSPHFTLSVTIAPENKSDVPVKILTGNVGRISNKKSNYLISQITSKSKL